MANPSGSAQDDVVLRVTVPGAGDLHGIAAELAVKVAEYLGTSGPDAGAVAGAVERAAAGVAAPGAEAPIEFVFRRADGELLIEARADDRASEVRHPLPA